MSQIQRVVVLCAAIVLSSAACIGGDQQPSAEYLTVVSAKTRVEPSARVLMTVEDRRESSQIEGVIDLATGDIDVRGTRTVQPFADFSVSSEMSEQVVTSDVHLVVLDGLAYVLAGESGEYLAVPASRLGVDGGAQDVRAADPAGLLEHLAAAGVELDTLEPGEVRGTPTTRLQATRTVGDWMREQGSPIPPGTVLDDIPQTVVLDIDDGDRLRRVEMRHPSHTSVDGTIQVDDTSTAVTTWELWDFGVAETIQAPGPLVDGLPAVEFTDTAADQEPDLDGVVPLIPSSGEAGGGDDRWGFNRDVPAVGTTAADAVEQVVADQVRLLAAQGWTVTERETSTPEHREFNITDREWSGWMILWFHPAGANIIVEGEVVRAP